MWREGWIIFFQNKLRECCLHLVQPPCNEISNQDYVRKSDSVVGSNGCLLGRVQNIGQKRSCWPTQASFFVGANVNDVFSAQTLTENTFTP